MYIKKIANIALIFILIFCCFASITSNAEAKSPEVKVSVKKEAVKDKKGKIVKYNIIVKAKYPPKTYRRYLGVITPPGYFEKGWDEGNTSYPEKKYYKEKAITKTKSYTFTKSDYNKAKKKNGYAVLDVWAGCKYATTVKGKEKIKILTSPHKSINIKFPTTR